MCCGCVSHTHTRTHARSSPAQQYHTPALGHGAGREIRQRGPELDVGARADAQLRGDAVALVSPACTIALQIRLGPCDFWWGRSRVVDCSVVVSAANIAQDFTWLQRVRRFLLHLPSCIAFSTATTTTPTTPPPAAATTNTSTATTTTAADPTPTTPTTATAVLLRRRRRQ